MWFQQSSIHQKKADQWLMYSKISNEYSLSSYYIQFQFSITCSWKLNNCCDLTGHGFIRFNKNFPLKEQSKPQISVKTECMVANFFDFTLKLHVLLPLRTQIRYVLFLVSHSLQLHRCARRILILPSSLCVNIISYQRIYITLYACSS
jgi:hypothetical protein